MNILRGSYSKKYLDIIRKIEEERYFMEKMSLDDCERFRALSNLQSELLTTEEDNIFSYGFSLGLLIMLDVSDIAETMFNN